MHRLPETLKFLERGELSGFQAGTVAENVRGLPVEVARKVQHEVLTKADLPAASFQRSVKRAVLAADPASAEERRQRSVADRRMCAGRCEVDHRIRWEDGGETNADNLHAFSGRHHHAKDAHGWQARLMKDATTRWVSPTGHVYDVPPASYPIDRTVQEADPDRPPF